jgi:hypothetical protein
VDHIDEALSIAPVVCVQNAYALACVATRPGRGVRRARHRVRAVLRDRRDRSRVHVDENVAAGAVRLTPGDLALLG